MISTVDPEARHAHKTRAPQDGFKAHLVGRARHRADHRAALTKATGPENSDAAVGGELLDTDPTMPAPAAGPLRAAGLGACRTVQVEVFLADSAYGTGDLLRGLDQAGHTAMIKPWPLRPAVEGGFTLDDFTVDEAAGTRDLPEGESPVDHRAGLRCSGPPARLPAPGPLHHLSATGRTLRASRARRAAARAPPRAQTRLPSRLPPAPAHGRTVHRLARPRQPARPATAASQERRLAAPASPRLNLRRLLTLGLTGNEGTGRWDKSTRARTHGQIQIPHQLEMTPPRSEAEFRD